MKRSLVLILAALAATAAWAAETGTALKADSLRAEPFGDAASIGSIKRGDTLEIVDKKGAWLKVKASKGSGWVRLLSVKRGVAGSSNEAAGLLGLATGRAGTGQVVATTGVRGLNEEDLKSAKFNAEEIKKLEANTVGAEEGEKFAAAGGLRARKIAYLPAPKETQQ